MSVWSDYENRMQARGVTKRDVLLERERRSLAIKSRKSLSTHNVTMGIDDSGEVKELTIINTEYSDLKNIFHLNGEKLICGQLFTWANSIWLITEVDPNDEVHSQGKAQRCNYLLRWIEEDGQIYERWCVIEDGTKYIAGEFESDGYVITQGDSRVAMAIAKDEHTTQFNRTNRFIIDDYESNSVLAYRLTKPFKLSGVYNGSGIFRFILQECNTEDSDNIELHIANYYDYYKEEDAEIPESTPELPDGESEDDDKWL